MNNGSIEEAFYLYHSLMCIKIVDHNDCEQNINELWKYMMSKRETFPVLYKVYSHLRIKNWVVRSGSQYGVDFVAYPHHPSLVHAEYAVLVLSSAQNGTSNGRLRVWSDFQCILRLCGSVAKTLLVLNIIEDISCAASPSFLESYVLKREQSQDGVQSNVVKELLRIIQT